MATLSQIEANRRNSQKSTGPATAAGKAVSSQNATRTGLYANSLLIDGDDPDELQALAHQYHDDCRPVGPRELSVVESLVHTDWLLRRLRRVETQEWNSEFDHLRKVRGDEFNETYGLISVYTRVEDRLDRIQRRITTLERLYHRRLAELERLQANRPPSPDPCPCLIRTEPDPPTPPAPEIGFVPSISLPTLLVPVREADESPARSAARPLAPLPPTPTPPTNV